MLDATPPIYRRTSVLMAAVSAAALLTAAPAVSMAQDTSAQSSDTTTVIVTAQKREQKLQDVPIVVTSLSAKLLQDAGVHDIKDMQILTPGLTVTSTQNETLTTARIRGVGTVGDNPGLESSVGVVIDGVYRPRNGVGFEDLGELERIEVLKGPQGTLFGKNTSAGVINIITKKPQFTFSADGEATFGNYGQKGFAVGVTGPIAKDLVAGRLYLAHREHDGFTNVNPGVGPRTKTDDQDQDVNTVRGQLLFTPNDDLDIRVIGDYSHRNEYCCVAVQTGVPSVHPNSTDIVNALAGGNGVSTSPNPDARIAYSNRDTHQVVRDGGVSIETNLKLPNLMNSTLTAVTGIRDWESTNGQDLDYSGADLLYRKDNGDFSARFKTFSQEIRLAGATDRLNWLVGGFYVKEDLYRNDSYVYGSQYEPYIGLALSNGADLAFVSKLTKLPFGTSFASGAQARDHYTQKDESFALFTNDSWKLTDALELTVGLRYTNEKKSMTALYTNSDNGRGCNAGLVQYGTAAALMQAYGGAAGAVMHGANPYWVGAIQAGKATTLVGTLCPFWANPAFNNRRVADSNSDGDTSGTIKLAWHPSDNLMAYVSYARGYKAGGYNLDRAQTGITPDNDLWFPAETADSGEIGLKTSLADGALNLNVAYFDQKYKDFQLNTFSGVAFVVESIPTLTSKGIDADVYWRTPIPGVSFQGGITYSDTKYGQFGANDLLNPAHFAFLSSLPGQQMSFAPKWSSSGALSWQHTFGSMRAFGNITAKYMSKYNTGSDLFVEKEQEAYTLVNARFGIGPADRAWTVEVWGQNLTDETYRQVVINAPLQGTTEATNTYDAFLGAPKTYGVTLRVHY